MSRLLENRTPLMQAWIAAGLVLAAVCIGIIVPYEPKLLLAGLSGLFLLFLAFLFPDRMSLVLLTTSIISVQYVFDVKLLGLDLQSVYKLVIILFLLPAMLRYGIRSVMLLPIAALLLMMLSTYLFADWHPLLTSTGPLQAFFGLTAPLLLLTVRWRKETAMQHIRLLVWLPALSVTLGAILQAAGLHELYVTEFSGAFRLQGASIPAHLAFLAFIAFVVSFVELKRQSNKQRFFFVMMVINFLILLLTGTRGPLVAAVPMIVWFVFDLSKQFVKGKTTLLIPLFGFIGVLTASAFWQLDNLMKRSFERQSDTFIDLSGRYEAWTFFLDGVRSSPWFGRGLGSVLVANDGSIFEGFVVPHNEYIRFYFDGGYIGAILLFLALIIVSIYVLKKSDRLTRGYMAALLAGFYPYSFSDNTLSTVQFIVPFCVYLGAVLQLAGHDEKEESYG